MFRASYVLKTGGVLEVWHATIRCCCDLLSASGRGVLASEEKIRAARKENQKEGRVDAADAVDARMD